MMFGKLRIRSRWLRLMGKRAPFERGIYAQRKRTNRRLARYFFPGKFRRWDAIF